MSRPLFPTISWVTGPEAIIVELPQLRSAWASAMMFVVERGSLNRLQETSTIWAVKTHYYEAVLQITGDMFGRVIDRVPKDHQLRKTQVDREMWEARYEQWQRQQTNREIRSITSVEEDPYAVLHLLPSAPFPLVKRTYRYLVKENHPDRGGDPDDFRRIQKAYEQIKETQE